MWAGRPGASPGGTHQLSPAATLTVPPGGNKDRWSPSDGASFPLENPCQSPPGLCPLGAHFTWLRPIHRLTGCPGKLLWSHFQALLIGRRWEVPPGHFKQDLSHWSVSCAICRHRNRGALHRGRSRRQGRPGGTVPGGGTVGSFLERRPGRSPGRPLSPPRSQTVAFFRSHLLNSPQKMRPLNDLARAAQGHGNKMDLGRGHPLYR